jgi:hypothetical protein
MENTDRFAQDDKIYAFVKRLNPPQRRGDTEKCTLKY